MAFTVSYIFQARNQFSGVADKVARSTEAVRKKASALGRQLNDVGRKFTTNFKMKAAAAIAVAKRKIDSISRASKQLSSNLSGAATKLTAFATIPVGLLARSLVNAASDAEETRSKFNAVFGSIQSQADITASNLAQNFGLAGTKARELLSDTGDLLTGFGFTAKAALEMSNKVQELSVDLASFKNFSGGAKGASEALTKALLGERESLKSLGIAILDADVKARVKQLVLVDKMTFASRRQANAFATLQLATEQSKNAIGDFGKTSKFFANQVRIMDNKTQDLKESFGVILLPVATKIVNVFTSLIQKFTALSPATKKIILVTGGVIAVLGPLLLVIAGIAAAIPFMIAGLAAIGAVLAFIFSPIALIIAAVAALGFIIFKNFDAIKSAISSAIDFVVGKFNSLVDAFKGSDIGAAIINAGVAIIDMWASVFRFFGAIFSAIQVLASTAWESISAGASVAFGFVMDTFLKPLMSAFQTVAGFFAGIFSPVVDFLDNVLSSVVGKIDSVIGSVGKVAGFIGGIFDSATEKLREFAGVKIEVKTPSVSLPPVPAFDLAGKRAQAEGFFKAQNQSALKTVAANEALTSQVSARADVNVNLKAPEGVVQSIKTRRTGNAGAMNLGVNMAAGG